MRQCVDVSFDRMGTSLSRLVCVKELDYRGNLYNALKAIENESRKPGEKTYNDDPDEPEGKFVGWFYVKDSNDKQNKIYVEPKGDKSEMDSDSDTDSHFECTLEPQEVMDNAGLRDQHEGNE